VIRHPWRPEDLHLDVPRDLAYERRRDVSTLVKWDRRATSVGFSTDVTLDGCVDRQEGIADDETHAFFTRLMDEGGAMLWGRVTLRDDGELLV
jgi:hypothetical protein